MVEHSRETKSLYDRFVELCEHSFVIQPFQRLPLYAAVPPKSVKSLFPATGQGNCT